MVSRIFPKQKKNTSLSKELKKEIQQKINQGQANTVLLGDHFSLSQSHDRIVFPDDINQKEVSFPSLQFLVQSDSNYSSEDVSSFRNYSYDVGFTFKKFVSFSSNFNLRKVNGGLPRLKNVLRNLEENVAFYDCYPSVPFFEPHIDNYSIVPLGIFRKKDSTLDASGYVMLANLSRSKSLVYADALVSLSSPLGYGEDLLNRFGEGNTNPEDIYSVLETSSGVKGYFLKELSRRQNKLNSFAKELGVSSDETRLYLNIK
ncbi:MAG: hypothetical protein ACQESC_01925 [Nanobdellota archaeon]